MCQRGGIISNKPSYFDAPGLSLEVYEKLIWHSKPIEEMSLKNSCIKIRMLHQNIFHPIMLLFVEENNTQYVANYLQDAFYHSPFLFTTVIAILKYPKIQFRYLTFWIRILQLKILKKYMRRPRFEPGSWDWETQMLTTTPTAQPCMVSVVVSFFNL